ncbi:MAG: pirin family protein [Prevotellaceae bacterium]|jgi:redox-sensitive bicupin YhaK (pirin superfamily)|nr:pirin family protein [Prevotellaceae bacterium]
MQTKLFSASTRGHADHGWLNTHHTFSFASYHDPTRVHFGALRVLNDDLVQPAEGFVMHPHKNMEIISIPLYGDLEHKDSMGNAGVIHAGEVQVMSAGTGVLHSEFNSSTDKPLNFFQIWVFPNQDNVEPRYQQMKFDFATPNKLVQIVSPNPDDDGLWIYQNAWFSMGLFTKGADLIYRTKSSANGVFVMVVEGDFLLGNTALHRRDGLAVSELDELTLTPTSESARVLLMELPM